MNDDSACRDPIEVVRPHDRELRLGGLQSVEIEDAPRCAEADDGTRHTARASDCQPLLPRRRVANNYEDTANWLCEPAVLLRSADVAGREPKRGSLASNDDTMARGRKLRHGPRGRSGHVEGSYRVLPRRPVVIGSAHFRSRQVVSKVRTSLGAAWIRRSGSGTHR